MKKFLVVLLLFLCCSCEKQQNSNNVNITYDIVYREVDMSSYDGIKSTGHMFKAITVDQLYNVIDNQSSGVFYLGRSNCQCCQNTIKYLNEVASNLNVYVYYIDVYDPIMPIDNEETMDKLTEYIYDIVDVVDGEKQLQTPTVFSIINGKPYKSLICLSDWKWDDPPTESQIKKLENKYTEILKPFSKLSQD